MCAEPLVTIRDDFSGWNSFARQKSSQKMENACEADCRSDRLADRAPLAVAGLTLSRGCTKCGRSSFLPVAGRLPREFFAKRFFPNAFAESSPSPHRV